MRPIVAAVPGTVLAIHVMPGDQVVKGQGLVELSVMEMRQIVVAPVSGEVALVYVGPGATVGLGEILVELRAANRN